MQLNKKIQIPPNILLNLENRIKKFTGSKKAKAYITALNMLENKYLTLSNIKKIKNTIETRNDNSVEWLLKDKDLINWVNKNLERKTKRLKDKKDNKERAGFNNPHRKPHEKTSFLHTEGIERKNIKIFVNEDIYIKTTQYGLF